MISDKARAKRDEIENRIKARVKILLPSWNTEYHGGRIQPGSAIQVSISYPRPFMGRFDAGKETWTLDCTENETYSRTKQVRVAVDDATGDIRFNEKKFLEHIEALQKIVSDSLSAERAKDRALKSLPEMPYGMSAAPVGDKFDVNIVFGKLTLEQVQHLAEIMYKVQNNLEKDWEWDSFLERLNAPQDG